MDQERRVVELEAKIEFLREMVRELIARYPANPTDDAQMYAAIKRFNQGGSDSSETRARSEAYKWFDFQHIHRMR